MVASEEARNTTVQRKALTSTAREDLYPLIPRGTGCGQTVMLPFPCKLVLGRCAFIASTLLFAGSNNSTNSKTELTQASPHPKQPIMAQPHLSNSPSPA